MISNPGPEPCQFGSDHIRARFVTQEIAFALQVSHEAIGGALVDASLLRDFTKLQPGGRSVQRLQDAQHFPNHADGGRF